MDELTDIDEDYVGHDDIDNEYFELMLVIMNVVI